MEWMQQLLNREEKFDLTGDQISFLRTEEVLQMDPLDRECLSTQEPRSDAMDVQLFAFQNYTKSNCLLECRAAAMLRLCKCLIYFYPDLPATFIRKFLPVYKEARDAICRGPKLQCIVEKTGKRKVKD